MRASLSVLLATSLLSQQVVHAEAVSALAAEKLNGNSNLGAKSTKVATSNLTLLDHVQSYLNNGADASTIANEIILDADNFEQNIKDIAGLINSIQSSDDGKVRVEDIRIRTLELEKALTQQARIHNKTQDGKRRIAKIVGAVSGLVIGAGTGLYIGSRGKGGGDLMVLVPEIFGLTMGAAVGVGGGYAISSIVGRAMFEKIDVENIDLEGGK